MEWGSMANPIAAEDIKLAAQIARSRIKYGGGLYAVFYLDDEDCFNTVKLSDPSAPNKRWVESKWEGALLVGYYTGDIAGAALREDMEYARSVGRATT